MGEHKHTQTNSFLLFGLYNDVYMCTYDNTKWLKSTKWHIRDITTHACANTLSASSLSSFHCKIWFAYGYVHSTKQHDRNMAVFVGGLIQNKRVKFACA